MKPTSPDRAWLRAGSIKERFVLNAWKITEDIPLYALAILYCLALLALASYSVNFFIW